MKISLEGNRSRIDTAEEELKVCEHRAIKAMQTEAPRKDDLEEKKQRSISNLWDNIRGLSSVTLEFQKGEKSIEEVLEG